MPLANGSCVDLPNPFKGLTVIGLPDGACTSVITEQSDFCSMTVASLVGAVRANGGTWQPPAGVTMAEPVSAICPATCATFGVHAPFCASASPPPQPPNLPPTPGEAQTSPSQCTDLDDGATDVTVAICGLNPRCLGQCPVCCPLTRSKRGRAVDARGTPSSATRTAGVAAMTKRPSPLTPCAAGAVVAAPLLLPLRRLPL